MKLLVLCVFLPHVAYLAVMIRGIVSEWKARHTLRRLIAEQRALDDDV